MVVITVQKKIAIAAEETKTYRVYVSVDIEDVKHCRTREESLLSLVSPDTEGR